MNEKKGFEVDTDVFSGPLDLLLNLIEKRKLLINEISLAKITDDYISYVNNIEEISISDKANFILIASTLLLIKSKSLLPTLELTEEEEQSIEDLERRLKIHKRLKAVEPKIQEMYFKNPTYFKRDVKIEEVSFRPTKKTSISFIKETIADIIKKLPKVEKIPKAAIKKVVSLEEMINRLTERVKQGINTSFKEFTGINTAQKTDIIVGFLAMLQLVKDGIIEVEQEEGYSDIKMQTRDSHLPDYS
ncbi:segregation/condensation protein A [Candidatus Parcubacteria bacterium]|nr:segregation/condensation protein A [Candidatus Parcubacteria bacterium]